MFLLTIINGLLILGIGVLIIKFRREIKHWTGAIMFVEQYLGRGSTYFIIILIGAAFIITGFMWPFGAQDLIMGAKDFENTQ